VNWVVPEYLVLINGSGFLALSHSQAEAIANRTRRRKRGRVA